MRSRYDPGPDELAALLDGEPRYRVDQVWKGLYEQLAPPEDQTNLPKVLRARLADELPAALRRVTSSVSDGGDTVKELWELHDGTLVETVLMHYPDRTTVCISSQAGCAMACGFCATGQAGFDRQLTVGEIVEQVVEAARTAKPRRLSNVVFMGMGEPMANYDAVLTAVRRINTDLGLGARHLTISTVGIVPGIRRLAEEGLQVGLAVSLHAATDAKRDELVPINRRYPLRDLADACRTWMEAQHRRLSFEWAMIDGVNDTRDDAVALAEYARPLRAHVNLIPLNPTPGWPTTGSSAETIERFRDELVSRGVNATIRRNRGTSIDAACGQLRAGHEVALGPTRRRSSRDGGSAPAAWQTVDP
ncbi:MAG: 23S rRNA (adenine(2503)-C(2))-methyltransferase RlmN [Actinomycetota bacterium]